jgi:hypothetical protein
VAVTFSALVSDAISEGRVDWIPCDFAQIPGMFEAGFASVGVSVVTLDQSEGDRSC